MTAEREIERLSAEERETFDTKERERATPLSLLRETFMSADRDLYYFRERPLTLKKRDL